MSFLAYRNATPKVKVYLRLESPNQSKNGLVIEVSNVRNIEVEILRVDLAAWYWRRLRWRYYQATWKHSGSTPDGNTQRCRLAGHSALSWKVSLSEVQHGEAGQMASPLHAYVQLGNGKVVRSRNWLRLPLST